PTLILTSCSRMWRASKISSILTPRRLAMFCSKLRLVSAVLFALVLSHIVGVAQDQNSPSSVVSRDIHGQIRFSEGGAPAQNILVRLESYDGGGSLSEVFTDPSGKFRFSGLS